MPLAIATKAKWWKRHNGKMITKAQWQNDSPSSFARTAPRAWWVGIRWPRTWRQLSTAEQSSGEYQHLHYSFCQIRLWVLVSMCFLLLLAPFSSKKMVGGGGRGRVGGIQNAVQVKVLGDSLRASQIDLLWVGVKYHVLAISVSSRCSFYIYTYFTLG